MAQDTSLRVPTVRAVRDALETAIPVLLAGAVVVLWRGTVFLWQVSPVWISIIGVVALLSRLRHVPRIGWWWWLFVITSVGWSLAPGSTLASATWVPLYLAAFAVGSTDVVMPLLLLLSFDGLFSVVSLQLAHLTAYFSGSVNYLTGTLCLVSLPWSIHGAVEAEGWGRRVGWAALVGVLLYGALVSGARAVYLPLVLAVAVAVWRLARSRRSRGPLAVCAALAVGVVVLGNTVIPGRPVSTALFTKARATEASVSPDGLGMDAIRSRLLMWDQAIGIGAEHPLGTGFGTFRDTIQGFQRFPSINFASAHNFVAESFATQGWLGTILLLAWIGGALSMGLRSASGWPLALGAAALWTQMLFGITWSLPVIPILAFWVLGAGVPRRAPGRPPASTPSRRAVSARLAAQVGVSVVLALIVYWAIPCPGGACALGLRMGYRPVATEYVHHAAPVDQAAALARLQSLNPRSLWVWNLALSGADGSSARLAAIRSLAVRFPYSSPETYLSWATAAEAVGDRAEARRALLTGLHYFPPKIKPAGVPLQSRVSQYETWTRKAREMLRALDEGTF